MTEQTPIAIARSCIGFNFSLNSIFEVRQFRIAPLIAKVGKRTAAGNTADRNNVSEYPAPTQIVI